MQVSVSKQGKLGRQMKVEVSNDDIEKYVEQRLKKLSRNAKVDGFRKGKIPMTVMKERYGAQVRGEILSDSIQSSLVEALSQEKLNPVVMPRITNTQFTPGKPLVYTAEFEVYPEIKLKPFKKIKVEQLTAEISDKDFKETLDNIRQQNKEWKSVERAVQESDRVDINFVGKIDDKEFDGGKAENFKLELGQKRMIPGFEEGIVGMTLNSEKIVPVTFPTDYKDEKLAGKKADFTLTLNGVEESVLAELDDAFAERMGIANGGIEKLESEVRLNMQRELEQAIKADTKKRVMEALYSQNKLELPKAAIDSEIDRLQKQAEQQFGKHMALDGVKDKSNDVFEKEAERRVALGLIMSNIVEEHGIKVDAVRVRTMIESIAEAYQKPDDIVKMYYNDNKNLASIESLVLEDMVVETILAEAKVSDKATSFSEVIKPQ